MEKIINNYDSERIIKSYIIDTESFGLEKFCKKHNLDKRDFSKCVKEVKETNPELYNTYFIVQDQRVKIRLAGPISTVSNILTGIYTGMLEDGTDFDIFEFYKLAPYKGELMGDRGLDNLTRIMSKDFPDALSVYQKIRQEYRQQNDCGGNYKNNYAEKLYLFTKWIFGDEDAEALKEYMNFFGVENITPIFKASEMGNYKCGTIEEDFTADDCEEVFKYMESKKYPKTREIYRILKDDKILSKKSKCLGLYLK